MNRIKDKQSKETLALYLKDISCIPLLTRAEEKELGSRIQKGDKTAVQKLVESNLRFVVKFAKRYRQCGLSFSDLINEGNLGLITAAKRFDPAREVRFISYAVWWIRQSILVALANMGRPFKLPLKINTALYRIRASTSKYRNEWMKQPTLEEIAKDAGMSRDEMLSTIGAAGNGISLSQPLFTEGEKGIEGVLFQSRIPSAEQSIIEGSVKKSLKGVLGDLKEREQEILKLRYGLDDGASLTLSQIGKMMGVSRERIRQIQEQALQKIREGAKVIPFQQEVTLLSKLLDAKERSVA
jgi:RNA polymerase primary sigma factor